MEENSSSLPPPSTPHGALFLVLGYLRLPDLLSCQRVCKSFSVAINGDSLLWRKISVEPPLSGRLTDDALLRMLAKAEGKVVTLGLFDCRRITDGALLHVVGHNPEISKLYVPGCSNLTPDGVVRAAKQLTERNGKLECLKICGLSNLRREHLEVLSSLVCSRDERQFPQHFFYGNWCLPATNSDDDCPIDVNICPKCANVRLVFDCTREDCRKMRNKWTDCRGCIFCIARCEECGGCIDYEHVGEETACSHLLCLECWLSLPKCNMCNRPYCFGHEKGLIASDPASGFVCEPCREDFGISSHSSFVG